MKKLALLSLGLLLAGASCKGKEEEEKTIETPASELILGAWSLEKIHWVGYENGTKVGEDVDKEEWTLTFDQNDYMMFDQLSNDTLAGEYTLTADSLLLEEDGDITAFKLVQLNKKLLEFMLVDDYTFDSINYRDEVTYTFEK